MILGISRNIDIVHHKAHDAAPSILNQHLGTKQRLNRHLTRLQHKEHGIRTRVLQKLSDGSTEIADSLRQGHIAYVINTRDIGSQGQASDGAEIRMISTENNVTIFTALDTVRVLLDVLEETTLTISTIDA